MTYVSELNAQFAKEAMACQSMDNDEILNVRWATEDPNPTSKIQEQARLEEMGKKAIQERMDPRIVDAMRAVRALEEGIPLENEGEEGEEEKAQRRELEAMAEASEASDESDNEDEAQRGAKRRRLEGPLKPTGLLSADTMEGLKYFAEIRKRHENNQVVKQTSAPKPNSTALSLDYGSDED